MKQTISLILYFTVFFQLNSIVAQKAELSKAYKTEAIEQLCDLMNDFYIYPNVAKRTAVHLRALLKDGYFDQFETNQTFADALTNSVQEINNDKHMRIRTQKTFQTPPNTIERQIEERMDQVNSNRNFNFGFNTLRILEGNVAYLDLRGFAGMNNAKEIADSYMKLMSQSDAVIIDLSKNGGGSPFMVQYLCSFFFDEKLHLNSLHFREGDKVNEEEFWTLDEVGGDKMPDVPLFIITSERTFSGAEEFSYNMQTQERATLIGQTTGGGANPGGTRSINEKLFVFIPTGRAENPITKTSWEGTGVIPEVKTTPEEAFDKAHELAKMAANDFRSSKKEKFTSYYTDLIKMIDDFQIGSSADALFLKIEQFVDSGLAGEQDINMLGYEYMLGKNMPEVAASILHSNTRLFPESPNVHDSYGEALMNLGDLDASLKSYKKAVGLAMKKEDRDLEFYKANMQKVQDAIENRN